MELHEYTVMLKHVPARVCIIPCGDWHIGSVACDMRKLKIMLKWIARSKDVYMIGMGDLIDAINISDKRFSPDEIHPEYYGKLSRLVQEQVDTCVGLLEPIRDKIIGLAIGNHELHITKSYHYDVMTELCGRLQVKYLGWTSITRFRVTKLKHSTSRVVTIFAEHSLVGGKKKGNKINSLEDRSNDFDCDVYIRGHSHDKIATTKTQLYVPRTGKLSIQERKRVYSICPSYFKSYREGSMSYAEVAGYSPTSTGVVRIDLNFDNKMGLDYHIWQ